MLFQIISQKQPFFHMSIWMSDCCQCFVFLTVSSYITGRFPWSERRERRPRFPRACWDERNSRKTWYSWVTRNKGTPRFTRTRNYSWNSRSTRKKGSAEVVFFKATFVIFSSVVLDVDHDFNDYDDGRTDPTGWLPYYKGMVGECISPLCKYQ